MSVPTRLEAWASVLDMVSSNSIRLLRTMANSAHRSRLRRLWVHLKRSVVVQELVLRDLRPYQNRRPATTHSRPALTKAAGEHRLHATSSRQMPRSALLTRTRNSPTWEAMGTRCRACRLPPAWTSVVVMVLRSEGHRWQPNHTHMHAASACGSTSTCQPSFVSSLLFPSTFFALSCSVSLVLNSGIVILNYSYPNSLLFFLSVE